MFDFHPFSLHVRRLGIIIELCSVSAERVRKVHSVFLGEEIYADYEYDKVNTDLLETLSLIFFRRLLFATVFSKVVLNVF